ncbi:MULTISPECIES: cysteine desulfurase family protein [unclassified Cryobacterium]|uniref:cysteine desulfurase family protein n=1 Tax=unclassified Cryobacterium TaxID=2649013 RepID=UPI001069D97E|nr:MULTISPECIES: cysteine desulfurase family protein [unclassified Cryobacterium]TFD04058.1 cysteine desulfurase [Cryobacterium sp. TMT1-66-1]TFD10505.1 cysteine desulfurase [Cryobacterium sp. TMT1-2-2]
MIYLDNAATTPVRREALTAMWPHLTSGFGNPSSHHQVGEAAAAALLEARRSVAASLGCRPGEVTFTSGGTESDNLAIKGVALGAPRGRHIVTTPIEHEAVLDSCDYLRRLHGFEITLLPVDAAGRVDPADLARALRSDTTLVSVHYANNEVGTVQPVAELAAAARGVPFHTDAVQAGGWLDLNVTTLGVDALSLSGHKLGAPPGIGAVFLRGRLPIEPLLHGGGQERGKRSGTENVAGAVALAVALRLAGEERVLAAARTSTLRDEFISTVLRDTPSARLTGHATERLPGTASFVFPGTSGEAVLLELEQHGIVCSSGSACAAGSSEPSHVLTAMGLTAEVAHTAVRFTLGVGTSAADAVEAAASVRAAVAAVASLRA